MISQLSSGRLVMVGVGLIASVALSSLAQDSQLPGSSSTGRAGNDAVAVTNSTPSAPHTPARQQLKETPSSPAVREVLKMFDAGVSQQVIKAYVESTPLASSLTPADLIALKQSGVGDEITLALLKRSAQTRTAIPQTQERPRPRVRVAHPEGGSYLDPESYAYFQYYYLYPRTLAYAYHRLGLYPAPGPWPYYGGYYSPGPYWR